MMGSRTGQEQGMDQPEHTDVVVIGMGPGGEHAAGTPGRPVLVAHEVDGLAYGDDHQQLPEVFAVRLERRAGSTTKPYAAR